MSDNLTTIILISVIVVIVGALILGIVFIMGNANSTSDIALMSSNAVSFSNESELPKSIDVQNSNNSEHVANNNDNSNSEISLPEPTLDVLDHIANKYNSCSATQEMRAKGYTMNATKQDNKILLSSSGVGINYSVEFILNNNILSTEILITDSIGQAKMICAVVLADCIAQLKGYSERTLTNALNDEISATYTLSNQGIELRPLENTQGMSLKVDLSKDFSFLNR